MRARAQLAQVYQPLVSPRRGRGEKEGERESVRTRRWPSPAAAAGYPFVLRGAKGSAIEDGEEVRSRGAGMPPSPSLQKFR